MIKVEIITVNYDNKLGNLKYCDGKDCPKNPNYIDIKDPFFRIKSGTKIICVLNKSNFNMINRACDSYYCPDCADQIFKYLKSSFDRNLWIFND
jgi:hypothetical protein